MDNLTKEQRRRNMQNIHSKDTLPEQLVMRELRKRKIYFAKHVRTLTGNPDIVFRKKRVIVFIDSDFWHGHPSRLIKPKTNRRYWEQKIARNKQRDKEVNQFLRLQGWLVIRLWEKDIKRNLGKCMSQVLNTINYAL